MPVSIVLNLVLNVGPSRPGSAPHSAGESGAKRVYRLSGGAGRAGAVDCGSGGPVPYWSHIEPPPSAASGATRFFANPNLGGELTPPPIAGAAAGISPLLRGGGGPGGGPGGGGGEWSMEVSGAGGAVVPSDDLP